MADDKRTDTIRALIFDVFGTLVDWRGSIARQAASWLSAAEAEAFADAWRARYQPAMEAVRSGDRAFVPLDVLHRENLDAILPDFDLDALCDEERTRMTLFWHRLAAWPDVAEGLVRLFPHYRLAPHSNGNVSLMVDLARHNGWRWDAILGAEVTGYYKPRRESYTRAADMLGLAPANVMLVAAHNADLAAAQGAGLATGFIARPLEHGPNQTTDLRAEADWDVTVDDLLDLATRLTGAQQ